MLDHTNHCRGPPVFGPPVFGSVFFVPSCPQPSARNKQTHIHIYIYLCIYNVYNARVSLLEGWKGESESLKKTNTNRNWGAFAASVQKRDPATCQVGLSCFVCFSYLFIYDMSSLLPSFRRAVASVRMFVLQLLPRVSL